MYYRGGDWNKGGKCHLETMPEQGSASVPKDSWSQFKIANSAILAHKNSSQVFMVLNVTKMTSQRKDGHLSKYYLGPNATSNRQDCSHWCLPGVPDAWNELLYALFLKYETSY
jgi:hypothetical protein